MKKDFTSINDLSVDEILAIFKMADDESLFDKNSRYLNNKILASVFFCESIRTRLGFSSAFTKMGGKVLSINNLESHYSDYYKESCSDLGSIVGSYSDIVIARLNDVKEFDDFRNSCEVTCISGGCTKTEHPTQTLIDLYAINKLLGRLNDFNILISSSMGWGMIKSLIIALHRFDDIHIDLTHHNEEPIPDYLFNNVEKPLRINFLDNKGDWNRISNAGIYDVIYVGAPDVENITEPQEIYQKYMLRNSHLDKFTKKPYVLSAMPRTLSIHEDVDEYANAKYFQQSSWGLGVRAALLKHLM